MWIDVKQNTDEWFEFRLKKVTSSKFSTIMANGEKTFGKPALEYAQRIALEIITNQKDTTDNFRNGYIDRGHEYESVARELYEKESFVEVTNGGFYCTEKYGDSNDGNVGKKGCIEIKSVIPNTQWKRLKTNMYDTSYKWQIQGHNWQGKKEWCDFVSYCPEMPINKQLFKYRVYRDEKMITQLENKLKLFWVEVEKNVEILNQ